MGTATSDPTTTAGPPRASRRGLLPRPRRPRPAALYAPLLAFFLTSAAFCAAWAARGSAPFGPVGRAVNDQANQYVPFH
ncbi:hypothetical protein, partial [Streptomyces xanthophaeus]|uniref:hypothetical protein n=1 Tax=Streptomyces xanthophaeus TaxID=67385 RepID=UPI00365C4C33